MLNKTMLKQLLTIFLCLAAGKCGLADEPAGAVLSDAQMHANWHQASGPNGNYQVMAGDAPLQWSGTLNRNILWRTPLPEGGQSSPVVWENRLFVTTHEPWPADSNQPAQGANAVGYCIDADDGKVLWTVDLPGSRTMKYAGIFSDSTSPSPVTDGQHVWFFNASGMMGCYDLGGEMIWSRSWRPRSRHHSRQFEPILYGDTLLYVEVLTKEGAGVGMHKDYPPGTDLKQYWTYIHAYDKLTGKLRWVEKSGTAIHNTPTIGRLKSGRLAVLHGRGGGHTPLEKPYGFSLTLLDGPNAGNTLWSFEIDRGSSHYNSCWNDDVVCWFDGNQHLVIDTELGKLIRSQTLGEGVSVCRFDRETGKYRTEANARLQINRRPAQTPTTHMTNLLVDRHHYFLTHEQHFIGRIHIDTAEVEYLEVPLQVVRAEGKPDKLLWDEALPNDTKNSRGVDIGLVDKRSKGTGWGHVSAATPIAIGDHIFFTTMLGTTYVIDRNAPKLDEAALVAINDLGAAGETWSLTQPTYAQGRIYTRTMKEVLCIGTNE